MSSMFGPPARECDCGSGEFREAEYDGHGIFLFYACDECRKLKLKGFRSDIMEAYECDEQIEEDE